MGMFKEGMTWFFENRIKPLKVDFCIQDDPNIPSLAHDLGKKIAFLYPKTLVLG
jgi:hypothetical protein